MATIELRRKEPVAQIVAAQQQQIGLGIDFTQLFGLMMNMMVLMMFMQFMAQMIAMVGRAFGGGERGGGVV